MSQFKSLIISKRFFYPMLADRLNSTENNMWGIYSIFSCWCFYTVCVSVISLYIRTSVVWCKFNNIFRVLFLISKNLQSKFNYNLIEALSISRLPMPPTSTRFVASLTATNKPFHTVEILYYVRFCKRSKLNLNTKGSATHKIKSSVLIL